MSYIPTYVFPGLLRPFHKVTGVNNVIAIDGSFLGILMPEYFYFFFDVVDQVKYFVALGATHCMVAAAVLGLAFVTGKIILRRLAGCLFIIFLHTFVRTEMNLTTVHALTALRCAVDMFATGCACTARQCPPTAGAPAGAVGHVLRVQRMGFGLGQLVGMFVPYFSVAVRAPKSFPRVASWVLFKFFLRLLVHVAAPRMKGKRAV